MKPLFQVNSRSLEFGVMFTVAVGGTYALATAFSLPESEKEKTLKEKYPELVSKNKEQRAHMQAFFDKMKDQKGQKELDVQFQEVLRGGKGEVKRQATYDLKPVVVDEAKPQEEKAAAQKSRTWWEWWNGQPITSTSAAATTASGTAKAAPPSPSAAVAAGNAKELPKLKTVELKKVGTKADGESK